MSTKKVTAFVGSPRKGNTHRVVQQFLDNLQALGGVECEMVSLKDYRIEGCRGCLACFTRGEERCPGRDDRDALIAKIEASDAVVFASPNYSFQVSGLMKTFLDRLGFVFHRPRFFGKTFTSIVSQGVYGGSKIVDYFDFVGGGFGFSTVKGSCVTTCLPISPAAQQKIDRTLAAHARRFHRALARPPLPAPSLFRLFGFRMARTSMQITLDETNFDYAHYRAKGWFQSDYYYPTRLGVLKRAAGHLFDAIAGSLAKDSQPARRAELPGTAQ